MEAIFTEDEVEFARLITEEGVDPNNTFIKYVFNVDLAKYYIVIFKENADHKFVNFMLENGVKLDTDPKKSVH